MLIHGPRQCGKTTLTQYTYAPGDIAWRGQPLAWRGQLLSWGQSSRHRDYAYLSFDDAVARDGARADPIGFVSDLPYRVILDEIQHVPALFRAIKMEVDRRRVPGRFILTGSTDVFRIPSLSESLAGRLQIVRLHPLSQYEIAARSGPPRFPSRCRIPERPVRGGWLCGSPDAPARRTLVGRLVAGGFPPALARPTARRQANWYRDYVEALIQRDVREMTRIRSPDVLRRLLAGAASQTARLFNLTALASPFRLSRPTIGAYTALLERLFLLERLPPWHSNRLRRLVKSPKLHLGDTGLAAALLNADVPSLMADRRLLGQLLETFVFQELRRQASCHPVPVAFFHFRDKDGVEVDIVLRRGLGSVAGVEVRAAATVSSGDFRGLRRLAAACGEGFAGGVVLYDGEMTTRFGKRLYAVPVRRLWETA